MSPAKDVRVFITDPKKKEAVAVVNKDNLSLAIGKKGQNVRLASRLTHYRIDVNSMEDVNLEELEAKYANVVYRTEDIEEEVVQKTEDVKEEVNDEENTNA